MRRKNIKKTESTKEREISVEEMEEIEKEAQAKIKPFSLSLRQWLRDSLVRR